MLPPEVREGVESKLAEEAGPDAGIRSIERVGGGCVSPVARIELVSGARYFLKWTAPGHPPGLLGAEARGLALLGKTGTVRVPGVIGEAASGGWLLLEWIEPGPGRSEDWARLGADLAALHRQLGDTFGAEEDNFIGPLPQANSGASSWPEFWAVRRIEPQLRRAIEGGYLDAGDRGRFAALIGGLEERIGVGDEEGPSPIHGDLWSGNVHMAADGPPAVIDPSAYFGHREVDLAMAHLFGGFGDRFRDAYEEAWPLEPGYPSRRPVYQLYYLLVHVNLFGAGYVSGCRRALQEAGV